MACKADVKYDARTVRPEQVAEFVRELGFGAQPLDTSASPDESRCVLQVRVFVRQLPVRVRYVFLFLFEETSTVLSTVLYLYQTNEE